MPIKGLAERPRIDQVNNGKFVRLGRLNKGARTGSGKGIKLSDLDYFRFTPYTDDQKTAEEMRAVFEACYGKQAKIIDPVYLPINISGNFDISDKAWLLAYSYSDKRAPILLGRSDGESVFRLRTDNRTVRRYGAGEVAHADVTELDGHGNSCLKIGGRLHPWQQRLSLELILPAFNDALYDRGLAGFGVVEFNTTSIWDVSTLIQEYHGILGTIADAFCDPFVDGDRDRWVNRVPLREIPLRLYRQEAQITRPDPESSDPLARYKKPTSLCHWQISPTYARAISKAHELRGRYWLKVTAAAPMLPKSDPTAVANALLFDDAPAPRQLAATASSAWEEAMVEASTAMDAIFEPEPDPMALPEPERPGNIDADGVIEEGVVLEPEVEIPAGHAGKAKKAAPNNGKRKPTVKRPAPKKQAAPKQKAAPKKNGKETPVKAATKKPPTKPAAKKLEAAAMGASDIDTWAAAVYGLLDHTAVFNAAAGVIDFLGYVVGDSIGGFDNTYANPGLLAAQVYAENKNEIGQQAALADADTTFFAAYAAQEEAGYEEEE